MIFKPADILIPKNIDYEKWSVVACDQYTSEPEYWEKAAKITGGAPSTLDIIFPEVYLDEPGGIDQIKKINETMSRYLATGIFETLKNSYVYVERSQSNGRTRRGLIGMVDLEEYDFRRGSHSKIRATEGTIVERIPPRKKIRINAPLELPHILMLIDDREKSVIEPLTERKSDLKKLYDFDLMLGGGRIAGYLVPESEHERITGAITALENKAEFEKKYGVFNKDVMVFAVGDGNHSLATAKSCWDEIKKSLTKAEAENHPARYALVELENIHDEALEFEPIQRVLFDVDPEDVMKALQKRYPRASSESNGGHRIRYKYGKNRGEVHIKDGAGNLAIATVQDFLDEYIEKNGGRVDYIHGDEVVETLTDAENTIGFMVDPMEKSQLFECVIKDGSLPRKTFSMGVAADKRYYLECRKIR